MLEQQKGDTGAVSSLMGCTSLLMGSLGIQLISLPWDNTIVALGIMIFGIAVISLLAWPYVLKQISQLPSPDSIELQKSDLSDS
jgi:DHA1 family bicyclomycin/chloramphenicol resistance-like MFS transporter